MDTNKEQKKGIQSVSRQHEFIRSLGDIFYFWRPDSNTLNWESSLNEFLGLACSEEHSNIRSSRYLIHPADKRFVADALNHALETKENYCLTYRLKCGQEDYIEVLDRGVYYSTENIEAYKGVLTKLQAGGFIQSDSVKTSSSESERSKVRLLKERLTQSESRLREVQCIAGLGYFSFNLKENTGSFSDVFSFLTGLRQHQNLAYSDWLELLHPDDRAIFDRQYQQALQQKNDAFDLEFRIIDRRNHEVKWFHILGRTSYDEEHNPTHFIGTLRDITHDKEILSDLGEKNRRLDNIINHSSSLFYTHTPDGKLVYVSPQAQHILGCPPEEAKVRWQTFVTDNPANTRGIKFTEKAILTGEKQPQFVLELITRRGEKIWVEVDESPVVQDGKTVLVVGSLTEITQKMLLEQKLQQSNEEYRTINEELKVAIDALNQTNIELERIKELLAENERLSDVGAWEYEVETQEFFWTDGLYKIHDIDRTREHDHMRDSLACYTEEGREKIMAAFRDCTQNGTAYDLVFPFHTPAGRDKWIRTITKPVYDKEGKIHKVIGSLMDITDQINRENELKKLNATKDKLFSIIGHDLRNPIGGLLGITDIAMENIETNSRSELERYLQLIHNSGQRSYTLLNNLLDWTSIHTGKLSFHPVRINIYACITELLGLFHSLFQRKGIKFRNRIPEDFTIYADENMINTVFRNLISNALKFTPANGSITMEATEDKDQFVIRVIDTGIGIEKEELGTILDPFVFYSKEGTNREKGSGLGLKLSYEFVKIHGGEIEIESNLGEGTTFNIIIPKTILTKK